MSNRIYFVPIVCIVTLAVIVCKIVLQFAVYIVLSVCMLRDLVTIATLIATYCRVYQPQFRLCQICIVLLDVFGWALLEGTSALAAE